MSDLPDNGLDALPKAPRPQASLATLRTMSQIRLSFLALGSAWAGEGREVEPVRVAPSLPLTRVGEKVAREPLDLLP